MIRTGVTGGMVIWWIVIHDDQCETIPWITHDSDITTYQNADDWGWCKWHCFTHVKEQHTWWFNRDLIAFCWVLRGYSQEVYGVLMVFSWDSCGLIGHEWDFSWDFMVFEWDVDSTTAWTWVPATVFFCCVRYPLAIKHGWTSPQLEVSPLVIFNGAPFDCRRVPEW